MGFYTAFLGENRTWKFMHFYPLIIIRLGAIYCFISSLFPIAVVSIDRNELKRMQELSFEMWVMPAPVHQLRSPNILLIFYVIFKSISFSIPTHYADYIYRNSSIYLLTYPTFGWSHTMLYAYAPLHMIFMTFSASSNKKIDQKFE